jgi:LmbE family N-acetylglucosaminyl deacetylase
VLHVSPHPDDELIGAPATLFALRDAGAEIVNLACSLGSDAAVAEVRRAELGEACRRAGFALRFGDPAEALREDAFDLVVGPSPHDRHPAHLRVARQILAAEPARWWMWGVWGELAHPTTVTGFGEERLREIHHALEAHASQLARNDFRRLVMGRAVAAAVLAAEQVFGFGAPGIVTPYAEMTCEVVREGAAWRLGARRLLDAADPFPPVPPGEPDAGAWLYAQAISEQQPDDATDSPPTQSAGERCPECDGTGKVDDRECPACEGTGNVMRGFGGG